MIKLENIILKLENGILIATISRPKNLNALNLKLLNEIKSLMHVVYNNPEIRGLIITGSGNKAFVAGADIKEFCDFDGSQGKKMVTEGQNVFRIIENSPKPVIAAVNGFALGGGCELAMACHLRIASNNAQFGQPEVKLGIIPGYGGTQRLVQIIGKTKAMELMMTGKTINANEALNIGLVNNISPEEDLIKTSKELLYSILIQSPIAIKSVIASVNAYYTERIDGYKTEIDEFVKCVEGDDFKEGTSAFIEKRNPKFN